MLTRALLVLALSAPLAAQATWTVDDDGPADFASLQAAVNAAADGDTLLVRAGLYTRTVIDGKGLVIQGDGPVLLQVVFAQLPTLEIRNVGAQQAVCVRGLELDALGQAETTTAVIQAVGEGAFRAARRAAPAPSSWRTATSTARAPP